MASILAIVTEIGSTVRIRRAGKQFAITYEIEPPTRSMNDLDRRLGRLATELSVGDLVE